MGYLHGHEHPASGRPADLHRGPVLLRRHLRVLAERIRQGGVGGTAGDRMRGPSLLRFGDRKSTRLNSSHLVISYAVFCLKKKKNKPSHTALTHDAYPHVRLRTDSK